MPEIEFRPDYVTFDCYGTLINFEIQAVTRRLLGDQVTPEEFDAFVPLFRAYRYDQVCGDSFYSYEQLLEDAFTRVCGRWGLRVPEGSGKAFADAVRSWGPHADIPSPLKTLGGELPAGDPLQRRHQLPGHLGPPARSGVPRRLHRGAGRGLQAQVPGVRVHARHLGTEPDRILHVSSHTRYDIMPATDLGITNTVLLDRGYDPPSPSYGYVRVESLDELNTLLGL